MVIIFLEEYVIIVGKYILMIHFAVINGIIESFKYAIFDGNYTCKGEIYEKLKLIPFLFTIFCCVSLLLAIFIDRRMIINDRIYSSFSEKYINWKINCIYTFIILLVLLYSLLFMIPYLLLYLFYLFFILIQKCKKKKN